MNGKQVIDGHEYQFQKSGILLTGWNQTKTSYYSEFGEKLNGLQTIDEKQYLFDKDGNIVSGWQTVDGKKLYFKKDGSLATAKTEIDGKTYNFSSDGSLQSGWVKKDGEKYYYDKYGFMTKGWKTIDGKKYYFNRKGQAATNTKYAGYKFDKNGVAKKIKEKKKEETTENPDEGKNYKNGTYKVSVSCEPDEDKDFDPYTISMDITIKKDKITEISNITANTNSTNKAYTNDAKKGMVSKIVANGNADGVNTVSGATCSSKAIKDACQKAFNAAKK